MSELFHFLRPGWLVAVPLVLLVWWIVRRLHRQRPPESSMFSAHLLAALLISDSNSSRIRPVDGVATALLLLVLAAAGPTWSKQPSPWFAETAPLVIAMEVSDSMRSNDVQPTRLDRARFKALDLIDARTGARTALVAYAGTSHLVMPPTTDERVIKPFLEGLDPAVMPKPGASASAVLPMAAEILGDQAEVSSLVFFTDGFEDGDIDALAEFNQQPAAPAVIALVFGTERGGVALMPDGSPVMGADGSRLQTGVNTALFREAESGAGVKVIQARSGDSDLRELVSGGGGGRGGAGGPEAAWRDQGWWLVWPAPLLVLVWFRKGWTMQW